MNVDITALLVIFDDLMDFPTNEERGVYWLKSQRHDGITITLSFSIYENYAGVSIYTKTVGIAGINMKNCSAIHVLDEKKQMLEIIHDNEKGRCLLALNSDDILTYTE